MYRCIISSGSGIEKYLRSSPIIIPRRLIFIGLLGSIRVSLLFCFCSMCLVWRKFTVYLVLVRSTLRLLVGGCLLPFCSSPCLYSLIREDTLSLDSFWTLFYRHSKASLSQSHGSQIRQYQWPFHSKTCNTQSAITPKWTSLQHKTFAKIVTESPQS